MTEYEFEKKFVVCGERIYHSAIVKLKDHSPDFTDSIVIENEDFANDYWAIVRLDEDGFFDDTVEDNFDSSEQAWKRWDEMKGELCDTL